MAENAVSGVLNFCAKSPEEDYNRLLPEPPYTPLGASKYYPDSINEINNKESEKMDTDRADEKLQSGHPFNHNIQTSAFRRVSPKQKGLIYNISQYTKLYYLTLRLLRYYLQLSISNIDCGGKRQDAKGNFSTWGIEKILANDELVLEKQTDEEYRAIKKDSSNFTNQQLGVKATEHALQFNKKLRPPYIHGHDITFAPPPTPVHSLALLSLWHRSNSLHHLNNPLNYPPCHRPMIASGFPPPNFIQTPFNLGASQQPLGMPPHQIEDKFSRALRFNTAPKMPPTEASIRHSTSSQGSQSSSATDETNIHSFSPTESPPGRKKRRQNSLIPDGCPFTYEQVGNFYK